uniref:Phytocyanin domain-containing protein n=1 Tax=Nelumbo nucifera TaxID=4432 RepID=A0A822YR37_NELNU|nr:TPA_asm: hypothetical protein HUJ06_012356 [Nelumbo nucifera]
MPVSALCLSFLRLLLLVCVATFVSGTDHIIGANHGWNPGINYTLWANNHTFYVGDLICKCLPLLAIPDKTPKTPPSDLTRRITTLTELSGTGAAARTSSRLTRRNVISSSAPVVAITA